MINIEDIEKFIEMDMPSKHAGIVLKKLISYSKNSSLEELFEAKKLCEMPLNNSLNEDLGEKFVDAEDTKVTNHPKRYLGKSGIEAIDIIEYTVQNMKGDVAFNIGTSVKYLSRLGKKKTTDEKEDWKKALWYIDRTLKITGGC